PFDIVITDMSMPEMDGIMLAKKIKADKKLKDTILVMMSSLGHFDDDGNDKSLFAAHLTKPVKQSYLLSCLELVVCRKAHAKVKSTMGWMIEQTTNGQCNTNNIHILLAEDNKTNQKVATTLLTKLGFKVDAVENGVECINILSKQNYDVVLMDCQMPEMDGYETTRHIRGKDSTVLNHDIPIIAMTANAMQGDREKCINAGMDDYVPKPINPGDLKKALKKWLEQPCDISDIEPETTQDDSDRDSVIDFEELLKRLDGDEELIRDIFDEFIADVPRRISAIHEALEIGDNQLAQREAHSLKGASANLSAGQLREIAYRIEQSCTNDELNDIPSLLHQLEEQFECFKKDVLDSAIMR
ncbi:response regulator, partial [bacterium]|nr:response regulator [bacterium]MBU1025308.1 response regulator [bacterium]